MKEETPATRRWRKIVETQMASGLSVNAFAEAHGLKKGMLSWWKALIRTLDRERAMVPAPRFVEVEVPVRGNVVSACDRVATRGVVDRRTDLHLLRRVLETLS